MIHNYGNTVSLLPIIEIPDPVLRKRARKVRRIDKSVISLAYNMVDTLREAGGVGLAANQVGELQRIIVLQMPEEEEARIYINPEIIKTEGAREVKEGCLSIPGYRGKIIRSVSIRFGALDNSSELLRIYADGLLAQALEHEVYHLNGILDTDHLRSHDDFYLIEEDDEILDSRDTYLDHFPDGSSIILPKTSDDVLMTPNDLSGDATEKVN